jgi:hypothetical protein
MLTSSVAQSRLTLSLSLFHLAHIHTHTRSLSLSLSLSLSAGPVFPASQPQPHRSRTARRMLTDSASSWVRDEQDCGAQAINPTLPRYCGLCERPQIKCRAVTTDCVPEQWGCFPRAEAVAHCQQTPGVGRTGTRWSFLDKALRSPSTRAGGEASSVTRKCFLFRFTFYVKVKVNVKFLCA